MNSFHITVFLKNEKINYFTELNTGFIKTGSYSDYKNGNKVDAIYKKYEPIAEEDKENIYDEDNCKLEENFKKVLFGLAINVHKMSVLELESSIKDNGEKKLLNGCTLLEYVMNFWLK